MSITKTASTTLAIVAGAPATYDIAGFAAQVHVNVGEIETMSEFGGVSQIGTFNAISRVITDKYKGAYDAGELSLGLGKDIADAGQVILEAGSDPLAANDVHSVKITDANGDIIYFTCLVGSYTTNFGDINSLVKSTASLAINNQPIAGQ